MSASSRLDLAQLHAVTRVPISTLRYRCAKGLIPGAIQPSPGCEWEVPVAEAADLWPDDFTRSDLDRDWADERRRRGRSTLRGHRQHRQSVGQMTLEESRV